MRCVSFIIGRKPRTAHISGSRDEGSASALRDCSLDRSGSTAGLSAGPGLCLRRVRELPMTRAQGLTINPYHDRLHHLPAYGRFDPKVPSYLAAVTLDPEEEVIASVRCNHGQGHVGYLAITTSRLRWFQRLLTKTHDHWPLATTMVLAHAFPAVIGLAGGELFQSRSFSPTPFKEFVGLHQQMVEALRWEIEHAEVEPVPVVMAGHDPSLSRELDRLADQLERGVLSPGEFAAAKRRLLGLSA